MPNEFIIKNGFRSQGNSEITGSLIVTAGVTGSLLGLATSASYADSASYATTALQALGIANAVTNNSNDRILTATGNTDIYAETNLTYNGQTLTVTDGILSFAGSTLGRIVQSPGGAVAGAYSHAQGLAVNANGEYSHAEGSSTNAYGYGSHAEGSGSATFTSKLYGGKFATITSGVFQLTGDVTAEFAPGSQLYYNSAAYPDNTSFVVDTAVFGGVNTTITLTNTGITDSNYVVASLDYAYTSWGGNQVSSANGGHAEGYYTTAVADWSHAEGYSTQTFARYAHAEGYQTQANGLYSHAEGSGAKAFAGGSHAEGFKTETNGSYSHAEGEGGIAFGFGSHVEGIDNNTRGDYSHAEGANTVTGNSSGYLATIATPGVVALDASYGDLSLAALFTSGYILGIDDSKYVGAYDFTTRIIASSSYDGTNTLLYLTDNSVTTTTAIVGSISDFGGNTGDYVWGGRVAHTEGLFSTALGAYSHAEGASTAFGQYSHAEGSSYAYGDYSHAEGAGQAFGTYSHAEGSGYTYSNNSHAEGDSAIAGYKGYRINVAITAGVIELDPIYGDQTAQFTAGGFVLIEDGYGEIVAGVPNTYRYEIASSTFNATPATEITLVDTTVTTIGTSKIFIGIYGTPAPTTSDEQLGLSSHAEGSATQTLGYASHAGGVSSEALGWYQSVVGQYNAPVSDKSAFIVGDGVDASTRHNLLVAASGSVVISGSLITDIPTGASIIFNNLPTSEPTITGSLWISGSSPNHPNSGYLMIFNP